MRVLVTGGAGFIGSHTCVELLAADHDVVVIDNLDNSSRAAIVAIEQISGKSLTFLEGDVADRVALEKLFAQAPIDAVIHFAGLKAVGESVANPMRYYVVNLGTTMTLVETMRSYGVTRLVFSSSCTVYGEPETVPITEATSLRAVNPYGRTKLIQEELFRDLAAAEPKWQISLLRYFNPVGAHPSGGLGEDPRGVPNNIMPFLMQVAVGRREKLSVFGGDYGTPDGTAIRDYIHVVDLAEGHLAALAALDQHGPGCRAYNLGTGRGTSVKELITVAEQVVGKPINYEIVGRRPGDAAVVYADPSFAAAELGWTATRDVVDMCADHWRWQSSHPSGF